MLHRDGDYFDAPTLPDEVFRKRDMLMSSSVDLRWCDDERLREENMKEVAPGGYLNPYGWFVVGTTIGGNAVVVSINESTICFADHTWYSESGISYEDLAGDGRWHDLPLTAEGVAKSLLKLAPSAEEFIERAPLISQLLERVG